MNARHTRIALAAALGALLLVSTPTTRVLALDLADRIDPLATPLVERGVVVGMVVGVLRDGESQVLAYGEIARGSGKRPDGQTVYEIGSISKVFTSALLARLAVRGELSIDDPISRHLPSGVKVPMLGSPITLEHLATHTSGLPRLPDNLTPANLANPYADYSIAQLYGFLRGHTLRRPPGTFEYSNYGAGLLGHILALQAGSDFETLLAKLITKPLKMRSTAVRLGRQQQRRLAPGHDAALAPVPGWDLPTLAGAGGLRSTVDDLLLFARANLSTDESEISRALRSTHEKRHTMPDGLAMGLGWHIARDGATRFHNGMTGGYHSWIAIVPDQKTSVVVLSNTASGRVSEFGELVTRVALGLEVKPPVVRETVAVDAAILARYPGVYRLAPGFDLTVTLDAGALHVQATGQPKFPIFPESATRFFLRAVDAQIDFHVDAKGVVKKATLHQNGRDLDAPRVADGARSQADDTNGSTEKSEKPRNEAPASLKLDRTRAVLEEHAIPSGPLPERHETHAATATEASDGTLLAAWFGGTGENAKDVKIWLSRKRPGEEWSEPIVVDDGERIIDGEKREFACWNPVLFTHPDGTIYLWYKITGLLPARGGYRNWWGAVKTSRDAGATWSERVWLPTVSTEGDGKVFVPYGGHACGPVKNRPIVLPDGRLLCGASTETEHGWRVHFEIYAADDWTGAKHGVKIIGPLLAGNEGIQPTFLVHDEDSRRLQVLTREDGTAWSEDGGMSWTQVENGPIDTSKGLHAVTLRNGWHLLAYNPSGRTPLSIARSRDGKRWETVLEVLSAEGRGQMDYPTIFEARDGGVHVVHSWHRDHIRHLVLDADYLCGDGD